MTNFLVCKKSNEAVNLQPRYLLTQSINSLFKKQFQLTLSKDTTSKLVHSAFTRRFELIHFVLFQEFPK